MFTLLHPAALLALTGLLVPVAIHLWNRRPAREVAVGSLRWLAAGANRRLRNLKLEQLWLLLLRATLLAVLAVAVAAPVWRTARPASRGVVLLSPEVLGQPAFATLRPAIDSLRRRGYVVRRLAPGFARLPAATWRNASANRALARDSTTTSARATHSWARVQQAAEVFAGQPIFVVAPATLRNFQGAHSPLPAGVTWQPLPVAARTTWLQAAALRTDSLRLLIGQSAEKQTAFRILSVARPQPGATLRVAGLPAMRFESRGRTGAVLRPIDGPPADSALTQPVPVSTQPLRVTIYVASAYAADARYLQAALRAAAIGLLRPLTLRMTTQQPDPASAPDWLLWLSDAPVPTAWQAALPKGTTIWQEAAGPDVADTATLVTAEADAAPVSVFRRSAETRAKNSLPLWLDGRGRAILTQQARGQGTMLQLHTRLNPAWSELGDDPLLPARLLQLLQPDPADGLLSSPSGRRESWLVHDHRAIDPAQLSRTAAAQRSAGPALPVLAAYRVTDLRPWLVLAAGLLFLLERLLARQRENQTSTTSTI